MPPKKQSDMSPHSLPGPTVEWSRRHGFQSFGDRLNFLSPERRHLETGRLSILPPLGKKERQNDESTSG